MPGSVNLSDIMPFFPPEKTTIPLATKTSPGATASEFTSPEKALGALSWVGTPPSGSISGVYRYVQRANEVVVYWRIKASVGGLLVTQVSTPLPSDIPLPFDFSNQARNEWAWMGYGAVLGNPNGSLSGGTGCGLFLDGNGVYQLRIYSALSLAANYAQGVVSYITP